MEVDASYLSSSGDGACKSSSTSNRLDRLVRFSASTVAAGIPVRSGSEEDEPKPRVEENDLVDLGSALGVGRAHGGELGVRSERGM